MQTTLKDELRLQRQQLIARLQTEDAPDLWERLDRCGEPIPLTCTNCGSHSTGETHCKSRYCPQCVPIVRAERLERWGHAIRLMQWPLFLTLTIPNSQDPEHLKFLKKKWSAFRRRKLIKSCIKGGVATFEITNIGNGWHPHLHAIADCRWLSLGVEEPRMQSFGGRRKDSKAVIKQKTDLARMELSALWGSQIGRESAIVLANRIPVDAGANYVLKYAIKCSELLKIRDPIAPMLRVLASCRTIAGWGSLHPLPSPDDSDTEGVGCCDCGCVGTTMPDHIVDIMVRGSRLMP